MIMNEFCEIKGIRREFGIAWTPQQNSVAERKNKTLMEASRTMLADSKLLTTFWAEAVNTACYVQNRVLVIKPHNKTPYELFLGRKYALSFMRPFGYPVTIQNTLDHLGQAGKKTVPGPKYVLLPFVTSDSQGRERAQRNEFKSMFGQDKDADGNMMLIPVSVVGSTYVNLGGSILVSHIPITRIYKDHPKEQIIWDPLSAPQTRRVTKTFKEHDMMDVKSAFLYDTIEDEVYVCQPPGFEDLHFPDK
nr:ribonuclease H-like domain-containing protein [Tanacetum cinerariifolium]